MRHLLCWLVKTGRSHELGQTARVSVERKAASSSSQRGELGADFNAHLGLQCHVSGLATPAKPSCNIPDRQEPDCFSTSTSMHIVLNCDGIDQGCTGNGVLRFGVCPDRIYMWRWLRED
jgi:hypothetical protein